MSMNRSRQTGKFFMGGDNKEIILPENEFLKEAEKAREKKEQEELAQKLKEVHEAKQREIQERLEGLEIVPNGNKLILMPYPSNPYVQVVTDSGIYIETSDVFLNPDSGEMDYKKELVSCGKVMGVGPDVKYVKEGDDVYYDSRTAYPLPFMSMGYQTTSETQIIAIINNDLKERLNI